MKLKGLLVLLAFVLVLVIFVYLPYCSGTSTNTEVCYDEKQNIVGCPPSSVDCDRKTKVSNPSNITSCSDYDKDCKTWKEGDSRKDKCIKACNSIPSSTLKLKCIKSFNANTAVETSTTDSNLNTHNYARVNFTPVQYQCWQKHTMGKADAQCLDVYFDPVFDKGYTPGDWVGNRFSQSEVVQRAAKVACNDLKNLSDVVTCLKAFDGINTANLPREDSQGIPDWDTMMVKPPVTTYTATGVTTETSDPNSIVIAKSYYDRSCRRYINDAKDYCPGSSRYDACKKQTDYDKTWGIWKSGVSSSPAIAATFPTYRRYNGLNCCTKVGDSSGVECAMSATSVVNATGGGIVSAANAIGSAVGSIF